MKRLVELKTGIIEFETSCSKLRIGVKVNRRKKTSRFLVSALTKSFDFSLGMFLLWECGIIIGIKVIEDAPKDFLESTKLGKENARLSQAQNKVMRSRTGTAHYKWRQLARTTPTGVVVDRHELSKFTSPGTESDAGGETDVEGGPSTPKSPPSTPPETSGEPEEIFVPIAVNFHTDTTEPVCEVSEVSAEAVQIDSPLDRSANDSGTDRQKQVWTSANDGDEGEPVDTSVGDSCQGVDLVRSSPADITHRRSSGATSTIAVVNHHKRLRFDHTIRAALIQERCELPSEGVFYTALDIHRFTQDFANEIREVALVHSVSYKEAIDIYYDRNKRNETSTSRVQSQDDEDTGVAFQRSDTLGWYPGRDCVTVRVFGPAPTIYLYVIVLRVPICGRRGQVVTVLCVHTVSLFCVL